VLIHSDQAEPPKDFQREFDKNFD